MKSHTKRRCTQLTKDGRYCRAWALRDSDPPTCAMHAGRVSGQGAPPGNKNAKKHGAYSLKRATTDIDLDDRDTPPIDHILNDLLSRHAQLSALLDEPQHQADTALLMRLFALHGQSASRLGRLLRDRRALVGDAADGFMEVINQALDELSTMWGVDL